MYSPLLDLRVYISEDKEQLISLAHFPQEILDHLNSKPCVILKSHFHIDSPPSVLKKLLEEPEKMKLWDPNVKKTSIVSYLPSNNTKLYLKEMKPSNLINTPA